MWSVLQVLTGKLFETWNMLSERFLRSNSEDPAIRQMSQGHRDSLDWLKTYFADQPQKPQTLRERIMAWLSRLGVVKSRPGKRKQTALQIIRDKTAFHYDKLNLTEALNDLAAAEGRIYLAQHPANGLYYVGSALIFRTVFALVADMTGDTVVPQEDRVRKGVEITLIDVNAANLHLLNVLYGVIAHLLERAFGKPIEQVEQLRIEVVDAPKPTSVAMPMFLDVGS
jgi:hypothetical protein